MWTFLLSFQASEKSIRPKSTGVFQDEELLFSHKLQKDNDPDVDLFASPKKSMVSSKSCSEPPILKQSLKCSSYWCSLFGHRLEVTDFQGGPNANVSYILASWAERDVLWICDRSFLYPLFL